MEIQTELSVIVQAFVNIITAAILAAVPIIISRVTVWGKAEFERIKASQPKYIQEALDRAAKIGIAYAEQAWKDSEVDRLDKLNSAVEAARTYLEVQGLEDIDTSALETTIEALLKSTKAEIKQNEKVANAPASNFNNQYIQPL